MRKSMVGGLVGGAIFGGTLLVIACNTLPVFGPPMACIAGALANGALEDPMLIIAECAGATIAALIQAIEIEIANLAGDTDAGAVVTDAGVVVVTTPLASASAVPPSPGPVQAYKAHLQRILVKAQALQASGVK